MKKFNVIILLLAASSLLAAEGMIERRANARRGGLQTLLVAE